VLEVSRDSLLSLHGNVASRKVIQVRAASVTKSINAEKSRPNSSDIPGEEMIQQSAISRMQDPINSDRWPLFPLRGRARFDTCTPQRINNLMRISREEIAPQPSPVVTQSVEDYDSA
jgi:hypothetical protein